MEGNGNEICSKCGDSTPVLPTPVGGGSEHTDANEGEGESPSKRYRAAETASKGSIGSTSYWPCSPEAYHLFRPSRILDSLVSGEGSHQQRSITETLQKALERCIKVLQSVHKWEDCWRNVIIGRNIDNFCTKAEIFEIRQRATFLCRAYQLARLSHINQWAWHKCCQEACNELNSLGMMQATCYKTVAAWNMTYRQREGFPHPNPYVLPCGKQPLPRQLEFFPDAKDEIVSFAILNLAKLTIGWFTTFLFPKLFRGLLLFGRVPTHLLQYRLPSLPPLQMIQQQVPTTRIPWIPSLLLTVWSH